MNTLIAFDRWQRRWNPRRMPDESSCRGKLEIYDPRFLGLWEYHVRDFKGKPRIHDRLDFDRSTTHGQHRIFFTGICENEPRVRHHFPEDGWSDQGRSVTMNRRSIILAGSLETTRYGPSRVNAGNQLRDPGEAAARTVESEPNLFSGHRRTDSRAYDEDPSLSCEV